MEYVSGSQTNGMPMPPGVTAITDLKSQKRANKTLSKAVSLHLEGKLEGAARLLSKAIDDGERDMGLYAALGHIQYEMHDYEAAAQTWISWPNPLSDSVLRPATVCIWLTRLSSKNSLLRANIEALASRSS